jgi:hypothetical protein
MTAGLEPEGYNSRLMTLRQERSHPHSGLPEGKGLPDMYKSTTGACIQDSRVVDICDIGSSREIPEDQMEIMARTQTRSH